MILLCICTHTWRAILNIHHLKISIKGPSTLSLFYSSKFSQRQHTKKELVKCTQTRAHSRTQMFWMDRTSTKKNDKEFNDDLGNGIKSVNKTFCWLPSHKHHKENSQRKALCELRWIVAGEIDVYRETREMKWIELNWMKELAHLCDFMNFFSFFQVNCFPEIGASEVSLFYFIHSFDPIIRTTFSFQCFFRSHSPFIQNIIWIKEKRLFYRRRLFCIVLYLLIETAGKDVIKVNGIFSVSCYRKYNVDHQCRYAFLLISRFPCVIWRCSECDVNMQNAAIVNGFTLFNIRTMRAMLDWTWGWKQKAFQCRRDKLPFRHLQSFPSMYSTIGWKFVGKISFQWWTKLMETLQTFGNLTNATAQ